MASGSDGLREGHKIEVRWRPEQERQVVIVIVKPSRNDDDLSACTIRGHPLDDRHCSPLLS
jgi:hypothetical protein